MNFARQRDCRGECGKFAAAFVVGRAREFVSGDAKGCPAQVGVLPSICIEKTSKTPALARLSGQKASEHRANAGG